MAWLKLRPFAIPFAKGRQRIGHPLRAKGRKPMRPGLKPGARRAFHRAPHECGGSHRKSSDRQLAIGETQKRGDERASLVRKEWMGGGTRRIPTPPKEGGMGHPGPEIRRSQPFASLQAGLSSHALRALLSAQWKSLRIPLLFLASRKANGDERFLPKSEERMATSDKSRSLASLGMTNELDAPTARLKLRPAETKCQVPNASGERRQAQVPRYARDFGPRLPLRSRRVDASSLPRLRPSRYDGGSPF